MLSCGVHIQASLRFELLLTEVASVGGALDVEVYVLQDVGLVVVSLAALHTLPHAPPIGRGHFLHQRQFQFCQTVI